MFDVFKVHNSLSIGVNECAHLKYSQQDARMSLCAGRRSFSTTKMTSEYSELVRREPMHSERYVECSTSECLCESLWSLIFESSKQFSFFFNRPPSPFLPVA